MKQIYFHHTIVWCLLCIVACNENSSHITNCSNFDCSETVEIEPTFIDGCTNTIDIVQLDNFYVIQSDVKMQNNQLSVFRKSDNKCLFSFAMRGHGHDETVAMDMIQNAEGDTLEIIDQARYKILRYLITTEKAVLLSSKIINYDNAGPLQEVYRVNDSIIIFNTLEGKLCTYNDSLSRVVCEYDLCEKMKVNRKESESINFHYAYHNGKLCLGFRHINALLIGEVTDEAQIILHGVDNIIKTTEDIDKNMCYYAYVDMNDMNIMGQFMGYAPGFIKKMASNYNLYSPKFEIELYSHDLTPQKHLVMKSDVLRCKLMPEDKVIFSWCPMESKENIAFHHYR